MIGIIQISKTEINLSLILAEVINNITSVLDGIEHSQNLLAQILMGNCSALDFFCWFTRL